MFSSVTLFTAMSWPITRTVNLASRRRQISFSETFSSRMSIYRSEFVFEVGARKLECFSDGFDGHFTAPGPDNALPRSAEGNLVEDLKHHDARSFERRLSVAYRGVGDNVLAEFHCTTFRSYFHRTRLPYQVGGYSSR